MKRPTDQERLLVGEARRNPLDIAHLLQRLSEKYELTQGALAKHIGRRRSTVTNYLRLLMLPMSIQDSLSRAEISMGHAKLLLSLPAGEKQLELHQRIIREKLTVRQATDCAKAVIQHERDQSSDNVHYRDLVQQLQSHLGTKVEIHPQKSGGQIVVHYYDLDDLQELLAKFGVATDEFS